MTKEQVRQKVLDIGIVPVVRAASGQQAIQAAEAVCAGGIPIVELTMTVPGAIDVIAQLAKSMGNDVLIGAGTVLDSETAQRCLDAGAQFLVSPGTDLPTIQLAKQKGVLIMAGALTPTEVITAWRAGSDFVKIFPCGTVGGAKYIKALKAPLPQVPMVPTGGVNLETAADFLRAGSSALGIGGELISAAALKSGNLQLITDSAKQYIAIVKKTRQEMAQPLRA
jgi:2-dehydro-3-deoxyphosphogluconate aldolase/(4S)-4-hydroxy-2-oxoglutarate aldolase